MDIFPAGFLAELNCLQAVGPAIFAEVAEETDYQDAEPGEVLASTELLNDLSQGEIATGQSFLGTSSLMGSTVGRVVARPAAEVLSAYFGALETFGGCDDESRAQLLPALIRQSVALQSLVGRIVRARIAGTPALIA